MMNTTQSMNEKTVLRNPVRLSSRRLLALALAAGCLVASSQVRAGVIEVAGTGTASQTQTNAAGFEADRAIDGDLDTVIDTGNGSHTWQLCFPQPVSIRAVVIHNRRDCCQDLFQNLRVQVLDETSCIDVASAASSIVYESALLNPDNELNNPASLTVDVASETGSLVRGNIVRVIGSSHRLNFSEVEVFAQPVDGPNCWIAPIVGANVEDVEADLQGNTYAVGFVESSPSGTARFLSADTSSRPTIEIESRGLTAAYIGKVSPTGSWDWVRLLASDTANGIVSISDVATDHLGGVYMTGSTREPLDLDGTVVRGTSFVAKLDSAGNFDWVREIPGLQGIAVGRVRERLDGGGGVPVSGPETVAVYVTTENTEIEPFHVVGLDPITDTVAFGVVARFDGDGSPRWASKLGGLDINGVGVDRLGNVYVSASPKVPSGTGSLTLFGEVVSRGHGNLPAGLLDGDAELYVAKASPDGAAAWIDLWHDAVSEDATGIFQGLSGETVFGSGSGKIAVDDRGSVYIPWRAGSRAGAEAWFERLIPTRRRENLSLEEGVYLSRLSQDTGAILSTTGFSTSDPGASIAGVEVASGGQLLSAALSETAIEIDSWAVSATGVTPSPAASVLADFRTAKICFSPPTSSLQLAASTPFALFHFQFDPTAGPDSTVMRFRGFNDELEALAIRPQRGASSFVAKLGAFPSLEVAEELLVSVDARALSEGGDWENRGSVGGRFTPDGATPVCDVDGARAACFDGTGHFRSTFQAPASVVGTEPTRSMEAWVHDDALTNHQFAAMASWGSSATGREMLFAYGTDSVVVHRGPGSGLPWSAPAPSIWHHIVFTYDGAVGRAYVDGVLVSEGEFPPINTALSDILLGARIAVNPPQRSVLSLSRVRIHGGVLTPEQVAHNWELERSFFGRGGGESEPLERQWATTDLPALALGHPVPRPSSAQPRRPEIDVLVPGRADNNEQNSFFWSPVTRELYPVRPNVTAVIRWALSPDETSTETIDQIGTTVVGDTVQEHISGSPVTVQVASSPYRFASLVYTESRATVTEGEFRNGVDNGGLSVLIYADTTGSDDAEDVGDLEQFPPHFVVVESRRWDETSPGDDIVFIGQALQHFLHYQAPGDPRDGYVLLDNLARYDTESHDRASRRGPIIPVNRFDRAPDPDPSTDEDTQLVVVWYRENVPTGVAWGTEVRTHTEVLLPDDTIRIYDGHGSGGLDPALYPDAEIYLQPDPTLPGFNPNEEHALFAPENPRDGEESQGFQAAFALRDDLNTIGSGPSRATTSEPFVLVRYRDPETDRARMLVFDVSSEPVDATGTVGTVVQPPYPMSLLRTCVENEGTDGTKEHWFRDYKGTLWASSEGVIDALFYYPLQPSFHYPFDDAEPGDCIPFLALKDSADAGGLGTDDDDTPAIVRYSVQWPDPVPVLFVGETVTRARRGLPEILGQAAVEVVYDESADADPLDPLTGVKILDPLTPRGVPLPELPSFFDASNTEIDPATGKKRFTALPAHLFLRLAYDPAGGQLEFTGHLDESGAGDPLLLLNVLSETDRDAVRAIHTGDAASGKSAWDDAVGALHDLCRNPGGIDADDNGAVDTEIRLGLREVDGETVKSSPAGQPLALTAGTAAREGYVTIAFNNHPDLDPSPVSLAVLRVECPPYQGQIKVVDSPNPFDEALTLRHSGDFGGEPGKFRFEWWYQPNRGGPAPALPSSEGELLAEWILFETDEGLDQITISGPSVQTLSDNWFIVRYAFGPPGLASSVYPCAPNDDGFFWSPFAGAPGGDRAQLAEGWIKRVIRKLNPYVARVTDFRAAATNTLTSVLAQLGARFEGAIPFNSNPENLNSIGLIEAYESVLERGLALSVDGTPPVDNIGANQALLLIAGRLADFYMLVAGEAMADAADPTIGFRTDGSIGTRASTMHSFMNQVPSLLEEELRLLRGRDDTETTVQASPVYNRLYWNMTLAGDGEVAYVNSHGISDQNDDGFIDEEDARTLYPQGHGDAWGHYLSAIKKYYQLLRHPRFTWLPRAENVLVADVPVLVDYLDERKFATAAAARAKAGMEIVDLTYRDAYVEDPDGQWQGYKDSDPERAWGVDGWARRAGQGAYFDWVVAQALLPAEDTENTGIQKIDRTTVLELREIPAVFASLEKQVEAADKGLNPLGVSQGTVSFDIDPRQVDEGKTHFEQVHDRALVALGNAFVTFNFANSHSQELRGLQATVDDFRRGLEGQEIDYNSRLIDIFGYPYADDIGPGGSYPSGYDGPDLLHFDYVDPSLVLTDGSGAAGARSDPQVFEVSTQVADFVVDSRTGRPILDAFGNPVEGPPREVSFRIATNGFGLVRPGDWTGQRRAPGRIQLARIELLESLGRMKQALAGYDLHLRDIQDQVRRLELVFGLNATQILLLQRNLDRTISVNDRILELTAERQRLERGAQVSRFASSMIAGAIPDNAGFSFDALGAAQVAVQVIGEALALALEITGDGVSISQQGLEQTLSEQQTETDLRITEATNRVTEQQELLTLEQLVRQEVQARLELFTVQESARQAAGAYLAAIAEGQRLLIEVERFRRLAAASTQEYRYQDMAFRLFRTDAIRKYRQQFDLASRYVYLAAKAYDYETNLLGFDDRSGVPFLTDIVRQRSLGEMEGGSTDLTQGIPIVGTPGLADALGRMQQNFAVLKGQMGFDNPQTETNRFSLRRELFRLDFGADDRQAWINALEGSRVGDLRDVPEFNTHCRPFAPGNSGPIPGLVIRFPTSVEFGRNFFGAELAAGDSAYDPSNFATKIRSVGVWFSNYDLIDLANTPRVYLVPAGSDKLSSPSANPFAFTPREWIVRDHKLPVPFPLREEALDEPEFLPTVHSLSEDFGGIRRHSSFRAYHDSGAAFETEMITDSRLIGRSVWNTEWLLIIPGHHLLADGDEGLARLIEGQLIEGGGARDGRGISDILLFFQTYAYSGN